MNDIIEYLPFLIPVIIVQFTLSVIAFIHVLKHPNYKFGNKILWIPVVLFIQIIGPVIYFIFGKGDE